MAEYAFLSVWGVEAPIDRVWDVIADEERYPEWFRYVLRAERIAEGDDRGVGAVSRSTWATALPYGFTFDTRVTRSDKPHLLELVAEGELEGSGRWELSEDHGVTTVRYYWRVRTAKGWMNLLAPLARSAFGWNHAVLMTSGGEGLARRLQAGLVQNESYTRETASPVPFALSAAGSMALGALVVSWLRRSLGR